MTNFSCANNEIFSLYMSLEQKLTLRPKIIFYYKPSNELWSEIVLKNHFNSSSKWSLTNFLSMKAYLKSSIFQVKILWIFLEYYFVLNIFRNQKQKCQKKIEHFYERKNREQKVVRKFRIFKSYLSKNAPFFGNFDIFAKISKNFIFIL